MRARIAILGVLFTGVSLPLACEEFEPSDASTSDAGSDATTSEDTSSGTDGATSGDAAVDASVRTVKCGEETCTLPDQVCCVFFGQSPVLRFCAEGTCPAQAPTDASYSNRVAVSCDDPTDCETPGNVCCAASPSTCISSVFDVIECRAVANCTSCANADGGSPVGYPLCRTAGTSDCSGGADCSGTFTGHEQWSDYRFCK